MDRALCSEHTAPCAGSSGAIGRCALELEDVVLRRISGCALALGPNGDLAQFALEVEGAEVAVCHPASIDPAPFLALIRGTYDEPSRVIPGLP